jgi:hypothetical protein
MKNKKFNRDISMMYANGYSISNCNKLGRYVFGDFYKQVRRNSDNRTFDFVCWEKITTLDDETKYFKEEISKETIDYFLGYWGGVGGFDLKVVDVIEYEKGF